MTAAGHLSLHGSAIVAMVFSALVACSHVVPLKQVDEGEARWKSVGIQDYDFTLEIYSLMSGAPCAPGRGPINVEVRDGRTVKFGTCRPDERLVQRFGTVPNIFETIRSERKERPPRYLVRFNSSLGYPEFIDADYFRFATDSTARYTVRDFRVIR